PGTAFVDLALTAGGEVGAESVEELTLEAPLVLPEQGAVQLQLTVGDPDESGRRRLAVYSRADGIEADAEWTRHATGTLAPAAAAEAAFAGEAWPPEDAEPQDVAAVYDRLAE